MTIVNGRSETDALQPSALLRLHWAFDQLKCDCKYSTKEIQSDCPDPRPQTPEKIIYQGEKLKMCTEPLEDYFSKCGTRPKFQLSHTALWRRYIGCWEVVDDRLYLTDLSGWLEDGTKATVATVFPGFPDKVLAPSEGFFVEPR